MRYKLLVFDIILIILLYPLLNFSQGIDSSKLDSNHELNSQLDSLKNEVENIKISENYFSDILQSQATIYIAILGLIGIGLSVAGYFKFKSYDKKIKKQISKFKIIIESHDNQLKLQEENNFLNYANIWELTSMIFYREKMYGPYISYTVYSAGAFFHGKSFEKSKSLLSDLKVKLDGGKFGDFIEMIDKDKFFDFLEKFIT